MKTIEDTGVVYTQRADTPIAERVFFRQAIGVNADSEHFRPATEDEIAEYRAWQKTQDELLNNNDYE